LDARDLRGLAARPGVAPGLVAVFGRGSGHLGRAASLRACESTAARTAPPRGLASRGAEGGAHGDLVDPLIHRERDRAVGPDRGKRERHDAEHDECGRIGRRLHRAARLTLPAPGRPARLRVRAAAQPHSVSAYCAAFFLGSTLVRAGARSCTTSTCSLEFTHPFEAESVQGRSAAGDAHDHALPEITDLHDEDRKSTRLNSSHVKISYAVFCLKKKKKDDIDNS